MDMFTCKCGYSTNRKSNLDTHQKRKTRNDKCIPIDEIVVQLAQNECCKCNKILSSSRNLKNHELRCNGLDVLQCPTCTKFFKNKAGKSQHMKNIKCKPPFAINIPETLREEVERLRKENELFRSQQPQTTTNNNCNNDNRSTINNINIQLNNYDKPYTDHITNKVMKGIYETSQRDPALILNETVRRIYQNDKHPENHVIKITDKAAFSKVFQNGKEICLPMDGVIQTVLSSTGEFCADRIRDCHEEGVIIGDRARYVWQLMEVLGTDDREDDALNRSMYIKSIKSAFL